MPWGLKRFHGTRDLHFITFSCYRRQPLLGTPVARQAFESLLEQVRRKYKFFITGYVVMPEHVHILVSEPEDGKLSSAIQVLKQLVAQRLSPGKTFWQARYYDFNVWSELKRKEKLRYLHRNPVKRGLVAVLRIPHNSRRVVQGVVVELIAGSVVLATGAPVRQRCGSIRHQATGFARHHKLRIVNS